MNLWLNSIVQDQRKQEQLRKMWEDKVWMKYMEMIDKMVTFLRATPFLESGYVKGL